MTQPSRPTFQENSTETRSVDNLDVKLDRKIKILGLNVCGLNRRLNYPEFSDFISCYDILCFTETKTDDTTPVEHTDFLFDAKNRHEYSYRRSGGIVVGYKRSLKDYVSFVHTDSKYVHWLKLKSDLVHSVEDLILGIVYIPPENSVYSSSEAFNEIELDFLNLKSTFSHICLISDFNSRTSDKDDFIELDDISNHEYDLDDPDLDCLSNIFELQNMGVSKTRKSFDKTKNNFGNILLNFCRNNNMYLMPIRRRKIYYNKIKCG